MLTEQKRSEIIKTLRVNPNATAVAEEVGGVTRQTVSKIAKKAGIELSAGKAARHGLPSEKRANIIEALKANPNATAVAREVGGVSIVGVWKIAQRNGIELTAGKEAARRTSRLRKNAPSSPKS